MHGYNVLLIIVVSLYTVNMNNFNLVFMNGRGNIAPLSLLVLCKLSYPHMVSIYPVSLILH